MTKINEPTHPGNLGEADRLQQPKTARQAPSTKGSTERLGMELRGRQHPRAAMCKLSRNGHHHHHPGTAGPAAPKMGGSGLAVKCSENKLPKTYSLVKGAVDILRTRRIPTGGRRRQQLP